MLYRIRKVSLPYLLQPSLEPVPSALEGSKQDVQIQCNTGTYSLSKCNPAVEHSANGHLPATCWQFQDPPTQFPLQLITGLCPVFIYLHCTVSIRSYWLLFAVRLSWCTPAYSFVVRYCSNSSHYCYRKRGRANHIRMTTVIVSEPFTANSQEGSQLSVNLSLTTGLTEF